MSKPETVETPKRAHTQKFDSDKPRFIDVKEVSYRTGLGRSTIWRKVSDNEFVQPIKIKSGVTRWLESDIDQWMDSVLESAQR